MAKGRLGAEFFKGGRFRGNPLIRRVLSETLGPRAVGPIAPQRFTAESSADREVSYDNEIEFGVVQPPILLPALSLARPYPSKGT